MQYFPESNQNDFDNNIHKLFITYISALYQIATYCILNRSIAHLIVALHSKLFSREISEETLMLRQRKCDVNLFYYLNNLGRNE